MDLKKFKSKFKEKGRPETKRAERFKNGPSQPTTVQCRAGCLTKGSRTSAASKPETVWVNPGRRIRSRIYGSGSSSLRREAEGLAARVGGRRAYGGSS